MKAKKPQFLTTSIQTAEDDPFCPTEDVRIWTTTVHLTNGGAQWDRTALFGQTHHYSLLLIIDFPTVRDGDAQNNETIVLDETDNAVVSDTISPLPGPIRD